MQPHIYGKQMTNDRCIFMQQHINSNIFYPELQPISHLKDNQCVFLHFLFNNIFILIASYGHQIHDAGLLHFRRMQFHNIS